LRAWLWVTWVVMMRCWHETLVKKAIISCQRCCRLWIQKRQMKTEPSSSFVLLTNLRLWEFDYAFVGLEQHEQSVKKTVGWRL
jgi:hypothetical protein